MTRSDQERFADIRAAIERCREYAVHLDSEELGVMAYDAVLRNLAVIGEAVRALPSDTRDSIPGVPWPAISGLRNIVIHEYFRVDKALVQDIVDNQLTQLAEAIRRA